MDAILSSVYRLRVVLRDVNPLVWRRLPVRSDMSLGELHGVLQAPMGWNDTLRCATLPCTRPPRS